MYEESEFNEDIQLTGNQKNILSSIVKDSSGDAKFIGDLLMIVFGREILLKSSPSGYSRSGSELVLDEPKLKSVKGMKSCSVFKNNN